MPVATMRPLSQDGRQPCSLPLQDADLGLGNANWTKGLQAMSDWIWSGNLNPAAFPNNLARYFLQIPGIFEQQLNFSTTLIFDEPSFRNGRQVSGFLERPLRELVISLIAQRRRCWYSMTHHAVLGCLTAMKHGMSPGAYSDKMVRLTEHASHPGTYTAVENEALLFADCFATNPKIYTDEDCERLRAVLRKDNERRYPQEGLWLARLDAARAARAEGLLEKRSEKDLAQYTAERARAVPRVPSAELSDRLVNAQLVELAFLCLQFVALSDVFTGLNVPDEGFLADTMVQVLPPAVIARLNEINGQGSAGVALVPPRVSLPLAAILDGRIEVEPVSAKGARIPLTGYEGGVDLDKGLTVGGVQVGVYGWSFGLHYPGGLVYCLMNHPELARFEAPYSLPLLFNEDEWRNGTQTAGYVTRRLKEIVYLKVYTTTRSRYGLEHHTMFFYNSFLDEHGVGRLPKPAFNAKQQAQARERALQRANAAMLYAESPGSAPRDTYSSLELAAMAWVDRMLTDPHRAFELEPALRMALEAENSREVGAGLRELDRSPGLGDDAAYKRLVDHQIAELAMNVGHMDGLGRAMTMLKLESEERVWAVKGKPGPDGGTVPTLAANGTVQLTGAYNDRPGLFEIYKFIGISPKVLTLNELRLNPMLNEVVTAAVAGSTAAIKKTAADGAKTAEF